MQDFFNDLKLHFADTLDIPNLEFTQTVEGEYILITPVEKFIEAMGHLKHSVKFLQLTDITAVDYPDRPQRFEVIYQLLNMHKNVRLRVKVNISENTSMPSLCRIYKAANWYEREVFDMFGIKFEQHPNLERILTDYTFNAFPLRKDFPTEGHMEVYYDEDNQCVVYDPVNLPQARRQFDFLVTNWHTPTYENNKETETGHGN
ncbi:MAG: NADH-quinone oxidoreductase subunit C [Candidatus Paracaedibacteraceae bacterium]|nr:NADH-quinone oxidoreductase subunit C [Candidatus Paracaedibacteraceae bacterium]